jgi:hypothetical protein
MTAYRQPYDAASGRAYDFLFDALRRVLVEAFVSKSEAGITSSED